MIVDANGCITLFAGVDGIPFYTVLVRSFDVIAGDAFDSGELSRFFCTFFVRFYIFEDNYYSIKWKLQAQKMPHNKLLETALCTPNCAKGSDRTIRISD